MTETPQEHVDRLQRELAAAKVAQLQQELSQAQQEAGQTPTAPGYQPAGSPVPGWQPGGQAQPVYPSAAIAQNVLSALSQLGGGGSQQTDGVIRSIRAQALQFRAQDPAFAGLLTADPGPGGGSPGMDQPLSAPPRKVPLSFRAVMLPWKWWDVFTLFMVAVAPIALWVVVPASAATTGMVVLITLWYFRFRGLRTRMQLLKWGVVAQVRSAGPVSVGTYYSGTTYQNVRLPVAHGWTVAREWYSGPGYKTKIVYDVNGVENVLVLHGREYTDGVILANCRKPEKALCVSQFPYDLNRDQNGNWIPHVGFGLWVGSILQIAVYVAYLAFCLYLATIYWPPLL